MLNNNIPQSENVDPKLAILNKFLEENPEDYTIDQLLDVLDCIAVTVHYQRGRVIGPTIWIIKDLMQLFIELRDLKEKTEVR